MSIPYNKEHVEALDAEIAELEKSIDRDIDEILEEDLTRYDELVTERRKIDQEADERLYQLIYSHDTRLRQVEITLWIIVGVLAVIILFS